ncbi:hybrid sensor histidine kinase/response regulator [Paraburkholderia phenoliruptrix]|uniref:hybrid sensor histidine kinase/response regulator n=1 Tax=Paraburkholderia phenoliruptrix TaxID=252970 RepID=UPI00286989E9|nr:hybrid sensor histidine kinase/response regulator [Paraburkholderia phenoliruptrix]WMY11728.1 hybrid sensor histidine kinase/response regulator [Paraburkholderia phenoliruptrix]
MIVHDATHRKMAEGKQQQVLARERAAYIEVWQQNRLKDEFIAVLSHELKNPLNLIYMKADMLARLPQTHHIRSIQEIADAIQRSVNTQAQIIDDLLDFSRVNTGKLSLRFAPTDISAIIRSIAEAVQNDAKEADIDLRIDLPEVPVLIRGDAVRIEQIVWNLVSNALKFTPAGGQVTIHLAIEAGRARLEVSDTGAGITPEAIHSIFDMFKQAPTVANHSRKGGLGIGLSLVRQLAQLHGGTVEAFSEGLGRGSQFVVWLPADASSSQRQPGEQPADLSVFRGNRILLVEDAAESLAAMRDLFAIYEAEVTSATTASGALQAAKDKTFDLVVTDVTLPDFDGYWLAASLRALPEYSVVPIVAITGRPVAQEVQRARESGCDSCLAKPFSLESLADIVWSTKRDHEKGA